MATKVVMEALSPTMEEGRLVEWKKREGEAVKQGDVLAEVETDKAVMELVARADGTLLKHVIAEGTTVPVSELVALIGEPGEDIGAAGGNGKPAAPASAPDQGDRLDGGTAPQETIAGSGTAPQAEKVMPKPAGDASAAPAPPAAAATESPGTPAPAPSAPPLALVPESGRTKASPLARKMAADRGLDLRAIQGTGPEGRIVMRDVEAAAAAPTRPAAAAAPAAARPAAPIAVPAGTPFTDLPLSQLRKTIAKRLVQSIGPIPTFYLTAEIDMERVVEAREALNAAGGPTPARTDGTSKGAAGARVSVNDIIIKAAAIALTRHPFVNAWWQDTAIRQWHEVHIGMAVAIEEGLITPIIRHADLKPLSAIAEETRSLAARARERKLAPEEYTGATFSISNLGMLGIDEFTAVINPPEAAILAVGRVIPKPVVVDGAVAVRRRMRVTLSCDHRVIDGATGAQFLQTLTAMLENPLAML